MGRRTFFIRGGIALAAVGILVFVAFRARRPPPPMPALVPTLASTPASVDTKRLEFLALALQEQGDFVAAEAFFRQCLEYRAKVLGPENGETLAAMKNLANLLRARGNSAEAATLYEKALEGLRKTRGPSHPDTLAVTYELSLLRKSQNREDAARALADELLAGARESLPPGNPDRVKYEKYRESFP